MNKFSKICCFKEYIIPQSPLTFAIRIIYFTWKNNESIEIITTKKAISEWKVVDSFMMNTFQPLKMKKREWMTTDTPANLPIISIPKWYNIIRCFRIPNKYVIHDKKYICMNAWINRFNMNEEELHQIESFIEIDALTFQMHNNIDRCHPHNFQPTKIIHPTTNICFIHQNLCIQIAFDFWVC